MYSVELYGRVRRAVLVEGKSERTVAQEVGIARETVRKMLRYSVPPGYRRGQPGKRARQGRGDGVCAGSLQKKQKKPPKKRGTAKGKLRAMRQGPRRNGGRQCAVAWVV